MKRLFSYLIYPFIFGLPLVFICWIYAIGFDKDIWGVYVMMLLIALVWLSNTLNQKRVYLQGTSLLIYNLFSDNLIVVTKEDITSVKYPRVFSTGTYEIKYLDSNNQIRKVSFVSNFFMPDIKSTIRLLEK